MIRDQVIVSIRYIVYLVMMVDDNVAPRKIHRHAAVCTPLAGKRRSWRSRRPRSGYFEAHVRILIPDRSLRSTHNGWPAASGS